MPENLLLAIDVGTQNVKTLLFDPQGNLIDYAQVPVIPPYISPQPGWAEQDPNRYWETLSIACKNLWKRNSPKAVSAVALTTQRATVVNLDEYGQPLRPAILWLDQRRSNRYPKLKGIWKFIFKFPYLHSLLDYLQAEAEANWIWANQPDIWEKTAYYLLLSGYLTYRLTGQFVDSIGCQVGYIPFDYKRQQWANPWDWKWQAVPVKRNMLPKLIPPGSKLGEVTTEASQDTGILEGTPVIAAAADKACESLGAGCLEPSVACISYGTTATISITSNRYIELIRFIPPYPSAVPGAYHIEVQIYRGMWLVSWFKQEFAKDIEEKSQRENIAPELILDREAESIPPGCQGLILQPYWSPGLRFPGPEARGAVIGFSSFHARAHFYRAILEGLAFALREGAERIQHRTGMPIKELRVSGGGSRSDLLLQITADIFNLPTYRPRISETTGLGAAILAAVGLGFYPDIPTAVKEMVQLGQLFEPRPKVAYLYNSIYHKVYRHLYSKLKNLYQQIFALNLI